MRSRASTTTTSAVALAAIKLVHEASGATTDEPEIPTHVGTTRTGRVESRGLRPADPGRARGERAPRPAPSNGATAFIHVGVGRKGGIRPADLVGAIANESGLTGREIGPIRITEHSSVVGVPARLARPRDRRDVEDRRARQAGRPCADTATNPAAVTPATIRKAAPAAGHGVVRATRASTAPNDVATRPK